MKTYRPEGLEVEYRQDRADWCEAPDGDDDDKGVARAEDLICCARDLENVQSEVHQQNLWNAQLYSNRELASFDWGQGTLHRASLAPVSRLGENVIQMVVDSLVATVGKNRPKATPTPRGASWKIRRQAKRLDKFLYGEFLRNRVYEIGKRCFKDACVFGFGIVHIRAEDDGRSCIERVFPDEILVDQAEVVATGRARHLYRRRVLPASVVASMFPGVTEEQLEAATSDFTYLDHRPVGPGWVVLVEGWQAAAGSSPGRYVAAVKGLPPLADAPWKHEWFPFVKYEFDEPVSGWYPRSAVEIALNHQVRLNEINEVIRDAQDLMARPRILVAEGSRVSPAEFDNLVGRIIKYTGIAPTVPNWQAVPPELYQERDHQIAACFAQFGLNEATVSGQMPSGFRADSSAAVREYNAIQDGRLADPAQRFEQFYLDIAEMIIRVIKASGKSPKTVWYSGGRRARAETINWAEVDLDEEAYVLQLQASSIFNLTPAALRDELEKQLAQQLITPEEYRAQVAHPDLESEASVQAAAAEDIEATIEELEDGKAPRPTPAQDLVNGVKRVSLAYLRAKRYEDVPPQVLENFLDWLSAARSWLRRGAKQDAGTPALAGDPALPPGGMVPPQAVTVPGVGGRETALVAPPQGAGPLL